MGGVNRPEAQVSEVTPIFPQLLGKLGSVGGRSLKAGDRKKRKPNLKTGTAETEDGPQRWSWELREQQLRHALKWRGSDSSSPWLGGKQGRQAVVIS